MTVVIPIIPTVDEYILETSAVPLPRYAQLIGMDECAFWGVKNYSNIEVTEGCFWTQDNRRMALHHLIEAQSEIENVLRYPVTPRWFVENQPYGRAILTEWGKVIAAGKQAQAIVSSGAAVNKTADPHVVTLATTLTSVDGLTIYHPGTAIQIYPSEMTISGGNLTIKIPRCRTIKPAFIDGEPDYTDLTNFADTVDIVRFYNDTSDHGEVHWLHSDVTGIHTDTQSIFLEVKNYDLGVANPIFATYSSGTFTKASPTHRYTPAGMILKYYAGLTEIPNILEDAIVRLAHSRMPEEPCGCNLSQRLWARDRSVPEVLTRERLNCPFGISDGAWAAWKIAYQMRMVRIGVM